MTTRLSLLAALLPLVAFSACKSETSANTGIIVDITSDLAVTKEMNQVLMTATDSGGFWPYYERTFYLGSGANHVALPFRVELRAHRETSTPLKVQVVGQLDNGFVVSRSAILSFVPGKLIVLSLPLLAVCKDVKCTSSYVTCKARGQCEPNSVNGEDLPTYVPDQLVPGEDAAVRPADVGAYAVTAEVNRDTSPDRQPDGARDAGIDVPAGTGTATGTGTGTASASGSGTGQSTGTTTMTGSGNTTTATGTGTAATGTATRTGTGSAITATATGTGTAKSTGSLTGTGTGSGNTGTFTGTGTGSGTVVTATSTGTGTGTGSGTVVTATSTGTGTGTGTGSGTVVTATSTGTGTGTTTRCSGLAATCGPSGNGDCCASLLVTGGMFYRSYDGIDSTDMSYPATVADFYLDKYEITVGRFRKFVDAGKGTQLSPPAAGDGVHPLIAGSGWSSAWNTSLAANTAALTTKMKCSPSYQTWTDSAGANERKPINCLDWYTAAAFCAWDGGRLATEAEWNYAAAGGSEQRYYPWSTTSTVIDSSYAVYGVSSTQNVGSKSPKGDGKWGQSDLAGNVYEWTLDWYASYANQCNNCADLTAASDRVIRGGNFYLGFASDLRSAYRFYYYPENHGLYIGARCARTGL